MLNLYYCTKCRTVYAMTEQEASVNVRCGGVIDGEEDPWDHFHVEKCNGKLNKINMSASNENVNLFPKFIPIKENG